jgi:acetyltransferase
MSAAAPGCWSLPDGRAVTLRPIAPDDFEIETALLDSLSMETSYNRLFSPRHPSAEEVRRWTTIDSTREAAFVVTTRDWRGAEEMLAVGRMVQDNDGPDAEFALLVGDTAKRQGIGQRLLAELIETARQRDLRILYGSTLSANVGMLALGLRLGFTAKREIGHAAETRLSLRLK